MYIGHITALGFLPVGLLLLLNSFGLTKINEVFTIPLILAGALGIIVVEIGDILDSHLKNENEILTWTICIALAIPSIIYFASLIVKIPQNIMTPLPTIIGSFLFVEGITGFFIGS